MTHGSDGDWTQHYEVMSSSRAIKGEVFPTRERPVIDTRQYDIDEVSTNTLESLKELYATAFHNGHMYEDLVDDLNQRPEIFRLFLTHSSEQPDKIIGAKVIENKSHPFINYRGFMPVHCKRFCVLPEYRGRGIGGQLIEAGKDYVFQELDLPVMFGESNELGPLSLYGSKGALYNLDSIRNSSRRNTPEQNIAFFKKFITNRAFGGYRYPTGNGIQFVYCRDQEMTTLFQSYGYASKADISTNAKISTDSI